MIMKVIVGILYRLLRIFRAHLERVGINVLPINFYSNSPSIKEIESSFEYITDEPSYLNPKIFNTQLFREYINQIGEFAPEFNPPVEGDERGCKQFFWKNSQFSYSDAMSYYCFVRSIKPSKVVEIGSGFSTLVAIEAMEKNGGGAIHCIEPYPREFLKNDPRISLHSVKAQDMSAESLNDILQDGDILFIDSTHTVKTGSDCLHIYLRLLPAIRKNIFVHVHDVFLPFGMPKQWLLEHQIFWTEQYLLLAFLIDNPKASLIYGSTFNEKWNLDLMTAMMGNKYPAGGCSVWFTYNGNGSSAM